MEMSREDFVKNLHTKIHKENISEEYIEGDPIISVYTDRANSDAMDDLLMKLNFVVPSLFKKEITKNELTKIVSEEGGLSSDWDSKPIAYIHYNRLYDFYLEKENLESSKKIKIYRIEGDTGKGIYMDLVHKGKAITSHFDLSYNTPSPMEDSCLKTIFGSRRFVHADYQKQWFFGFKNKDEILKWFKSEDGMFDFISEYGKAKVVEYEIKESESMLGEFQIAFKKNKAKVLKSYPIMDVEKSKETLNVNKERQLGFNF
jgi:hypothetical protein